MSGTIPISRDMDFEYAIPRELAAGVRRIVANNPGPFTFKGTNTYLVGNDDIAVIDPGPDDPAHLKAILDAVGNATVTHIILTHTHRDHCDGLPALKEATGADTYGFVYANQTSGRRPSSPASGTALDDAVDTTFVPDCPLSDLEEIFGTNWSLKALHTPGHAPDHLCFEHATDGTPTGVLLSGDHVMGWSTSVIAPPEGNMGDYMASLERLIDRKDTIYLPGHGGAIRTPARVAKAYMVHRKWRENAILDCIRAGVSDLDTIVARSYPKLDPKLIPAAALSVLAHVELLVTKGAVVSSGGVSRTSTFEPS